MKRSTGVTQHHFLQKNGAGFTLIELLVVVAIIGLLASIIVSSIDESRERSRNTAKNSLVTEYTKALELVHTDTGSYPGSGGPPPGWKCLEPDPGSCQGFSTRSQLNNALDDYIGIFEENSTIPDTYKGIVYTTIGVNTYQLRWYLEGTDRDCIKGQAPSDGDVSGYTECTYVHQ